MVKLAINELTTYRWTFEEDVLAVAEHGFSGIGLWRPKLMEYGIEKASEMLAEYRLEVSSLSWAGGFTGSDGRSYRESLWDGLDAVDLAAQIGADTLIVLSGGRNNHTRNHVRNIVRDAFTELSEAAAALGVSLAIEPMHPGCGAEWSILKDVRQTLDVIAELPRDNVGLALDTYHLGFDAQILEWLPEIVRFTRVVQLGDGKHVPLGEQNRCLLGEGCVPLQEIVQTFEQAGYEGYYEAEVLGEEVEHLDYRQILRHTHSYLCDLLGYSDQPSPTAS
jgi:sugar phosphate isomerase/epimerase